MVEAYSIIDVPTDQQNTNIVKTENDDIYKGELYGTNDESLKLYGH